MKKRVRIFFIAINLILALATGLAYISPSVHPAKSAIPAIMALVLPGLLLVNLLFVFGWLMTRSYFALISIAVIAIGWNAVGGHMQLHFDKEPDQGTGTISLITYNTHHLVDIDENWRPDPSEMQDLANSLGDPDILCLQEGGLSMNYQEQFGYEHAFRMKDAPTMLFSKFRILDHQPIESGDRRALSGWFDLEVRSDTLRLFLLHLSSNRITIDSEQLFEEGNLSDTQTWRKAGSILKRYTHAARERGEQALAIRESIDQSPHPVIVCGDFNDVPMSFPVLTIKGDLTDSFREAGLGAGTTYAGKIPGLRIDYVMTGPQFKVTSHEVMRLKTSDHYPVSVRIQIADL